jgi:hypothetical protein
MIAVVRRMKNLINIQAKRMMTIEVDLKMQMRAIDRDGKSLNMATWSGNIVILE